MSVDNIRLLAKYSRKTNDLMNSYIRKITDDEWNRNFSGFFKSIHELCSHIYICDFNWLKRFKNLRSFNTLSGEFFSKNYSFSETIFADKDEYILMRDGLDNIIMEFTGEINDNDLEKTLTFTDSKGNINNRKMESLMTHVFNHQTHHRGMISLYLEMTGIENSFTDSLYNTDI